MSKQDQTALHLSVIEHLETQYSALGLPCFALSISCRYCHLSRISNKQKNEYREMAKLWLMAYLDSRCLSQFMQSMLFDQVIDSQVF